MPPPNHPYPLTPTPSLSPLYTTLPLTSPLLPVPSLILDRGKATQNCAAMLDTCSALGVGFRAHVKSHKTLQLAKLQVGGEKEERKGGRAANFVVSTVVEAEWLVEYVRECAGWGREASILYGVPPAPSLLPRLFALARDLPPSTINILLDNPSTLTHVLKALSTLSPLPTIGIFIKIDTGYHRAGIHPSSPAYEPLVKEILGAEVAGQGVELKGLYSHYGHSYGGSSVDEAADGLIAELEGLRDAASVVRSCVLGHYSEGKPGGMILTVGATPTATVAQTLLLAQAQAQADSTQQATSPSVSAKAQKFANLLKALSEHDTIELHAGVYPLLDLQQVATRARPSSSPSASFTTIPALSTSSISISLLAEITSSYDRNTPGRFNPKPERLISAGSLALGREPCKAYPGWGIVRPALDNKSGAIYDFEQEEGNREGWIVGKVSQEHGVLVYEGRGEEHGVLEVGERVLIWPNHACVAGAGFGWYLVVDSDEGDGQTVVDVWARWRGW